MPPLLLSTLLTLIGLINLGALGIMIYDKRLSLRQGGSERVPEGVLFFVATIFGSVGIYVGMWLFRHKIRKWYFAIGIPLLIAQNLATLYLLYSLWV